MKKGQKNHPNGEVENSVKLCVLRGELKSVGQVLATFFLFIIGFGVLHGHLLEG